MFRKKNKGISIGLYITPEFIVGVLPRISHGRIEVVSYAQHNLPKGLIDGVTFQDKTRFSEEIRTLIKKMDVRAKSASVALPSVGYMMRTLRLPDVPDKERRPLVRSELEEIGALPIGGGVFSYLHTPAPVIEGKRQTDIYAYFASDNVVEDLREVLRLAGLQMDVIEPSSLSLMRAYLASRTDSVPSAILRLSRKHTDLCVHDGTGVRNLRNLPTGWADMQPSREGEGFFLTRPSLAHPIYVEEDDKTLEMYSEDLSRHQPATILAEEVGRSLAFYTREYPDAPPPEWIAVFGPENHAAELRQQLPVILSVNVDQSDPLESFGMMRSDLDDTEGILSALGVGVAHQVETIPMTDISEQGEEAKSRQRAPVVLMFGMAGSTAWMVASLVATISLTVLESATQRRLDAVTQQLTAKKDELARKQAQYNIWSAAKGAQTQYQIPIAPVMGRLAASTTPGVAVKRLTVSPDGRVGVEGEALNTKTMSQFAFALGRGMAIRFPHFEMMKKSPRIGLQFRIAGQSKSIQMANAAPAATGQ